MSLRITNVAAKEAITGDAYELKIDRVNRSYGDGPESDLARWPKDVRDYVAAALRAVDGDNAPAAKTATAKFEIKAAVITADDLRRLIREEYERVDHSKWSWSTIFNPAMWPGFGDTPDTSPTSTGDGVAASTATATEAPTEATTPQPPSGQSWTLQQVNEALRAEWDKRDPNPLGLGPLPAWMSGPLVDEPEKAQAQPKTAPLLVGEALEDHIRTLTREEIALAGIPACDWKKATWQATADALTALSDAGIVKLHEIPKGAVHYVRKKHGEADIDYCARPANFAPNIRPRVHIARRETVGAYARWRLTGGLLNGADLVDDDEVLVGPRVPEWEL